MTINMNVYFLEKAVYTYLILFYRELFKIRQILFEIFVC